MKLTNYTKLTLSAVASLALVALPAATASAATQTTNSTITANISEVITLAVSGNVNINATPGGGVATGSHNVTVSTNNSTGYNLSLASSASETTLAKGADSINAATAPFATPAALTADTWGYRVDSFTANNYAGIVSNSTTAPVIKSSTVPATNEVTPVTWGVNVTAAKPTGAYSRVVTYTAVTRP